MTSPAFGPQKAIFFLHNEPERGSYFRAMEFARGMAHHGWHVTVVVSSIHQKFRGRNLSSTDDSIQILQSPNFTLFNDRQEGWSLPDLLYRLLLIVKHRPSLAVAFSHKPSCLFPTLFARLFGARTVLDWVDWWGGPTGIYKGVVIPSEAFQAMARPIRMWRRTTFWIDGILEYLAPRLLQKVILITEDLARHPAMSPQIRNNALTLHSGAPVSEIQPHQTSEARLLLALQFPAAKALPQSSVVLGYMAGFHGAERLLLDSLTYIRTTNPDLNFHLLVAGADLSTMAPHHADAIHGRIHHLGRIPFSNVSTFLGACDILLMPLANENFDRARYPHKLGDYLASGRPVVASAPSAAATLLESCGLATFVAPSTPSGYGDHIANMCTQPEKWADWGHKSRQAALQHWDWESKVRRFYTFVTATNVNPPKA